MFTVRYYLSLLGTNFPLRVLISILCLPSQTGSSSSGTTTTGADISTTIPSEEWAKTLGGEIGIAITAPAKNYPLFFIDSEGMGIRQVNCALKNGSEETNVPNPKLIFQTEEMNSIS